ncbi:MAG: transglycosylase domain-containing protein [Saprospiraceae bacterium]|nr:transglycosylase domain-containing protein [Saprospiraceae bacterium]MCB9323947.1 transglycosylase domain-containing protein [Lewinellaceae bacterium]
MNTSDNNIVQKIREESALLYHKAKRKFYAFRLEKPKWYLGLKIALAAGGAAVVGMFLMAVLVYKGAFGPLPNYAELKNIRNHTASEVYAKDGVLLGKYYVENRTNADFDEISPNIINALIATEDARFFEHSGIDFRAMMRVLFKSVLLSKKSSGGGSTLSQQLAKNLYPRKNYRLLAMVINKYREAFIARRLEKVYTKEELLKLYLNTVSFSENVYGIKVASQRFFDKSPENLATEEAALLIGTLKGTSLYNPVRHPDRATERRNTVLNQMSRFGNLTEAECDSLKNIPLKLKYSQEGDNKGLATYFREHLRQELEEILADHTKPDGTSYNLYTDGLKIYTTIDASMQKYAEEAINEHMPELQKAFNKEWKKGIPWEDNNALRNAVARSPRYKSLKAQGLSQKEIDAVFKTPVKMRVFSWTEGEVEKEMSPLDSVKYYLGLLNTGFLAIDPTTGLVKAWVGGINHKYFQYDHVKSQRQAGSTFKPIVYTQALRSGMLPCEYTENKLVMYEQFDNWEPRNADGKYGGVYSMEGALSHSVNTTTVEVALRAGIDSIRYLARAMGIKGELPSGPAIALGTGNVSLMDMIQVYGTFATRGVRPEMFYLDRVETADGKVIAAFKRPNPDNFKRVISRDHVDMMIKMMEAVVDSGTARALRYRFGLYGEFAGKTGTTQNQSDGWFVGYNPKLVAGVWVGAENPNVHFKSMRYGQGSASALPIWGLFMQKVLKDPAFKSIKKAQFTPMRDTIAAMMQCPPFLDEMPVFVNFEEEDYMDILEFQEQMESMDPHLRDSLIRANPRKDHETLSEYSERIRRHNERIDNKRSRQEKRKEFWNNVLFGDKKKN